MYGDYLNKQMDLLRSDPGRKVITPSDADATTARAAFRAVIDDWLGQDPRNPALFIATENEIAKLRSTR